MKVIDLLQRIANGEELPKKIQVYSDIFVLDEGNKLYEHENTRTNLLSIYNGNILNYEVRIKEEEPFNKRVEEIYNRHIDYIYDKEDKKIEKIETYDKDGNIFIDYHCSKYVPIDKHNLTANEQVFVEKINEIIKFLYKAEKDK